MYEFVDSKSHYRGGEKYTCIYIISDPSLLGVLKKHRDKKDEAVLYLDFKPLVWFEYDEETPDSVDEGLSQVFKEGCKWRDIKILTEEDINGYDFRLKVILWFSKHRFDLINSEHLQIQYGAEDYKFLSGLYRSVSLINKNEEKLDFQRTREPRLSSVHDVDWDEIGKPCPQYSCDLIVYVKQLYDDITNALAVYFMYPNVVDGLLPTQRSLIQVLSNIQKPTKTSKILDATQKINLVPEEILYSQLITMNYSPLVNGGGNWGSYIWGDFTADPMFTDVELSPLMKYTIGMKNLQSKFPWLLVLGNERQELRFPDWVESWHFQHNISEICDAAIAYLSGQEFSLYPDNKEGGVFDVSQYKDGSVGGKLIFKVGFEIIDDKKIVMPSIPYNVNFPMLSDEIHKAIKEGSVQGIEDVTDYENWDKYGIGYITLTGDVPPEIVIESLYANTSCRQEFINAPYVIKDGKIVPMRPKEILKDSVDRTRRIFQEELADEVKELSTISVKHALSQLMRDNVSAIAKSSGEDESLVSSIIEQYTPKRDVNSVRSKLKQERTENKSIEQRMIEYYTDIKEKFGTPRRSRIEL